MTRQRRRTRSCERAAPQRRRRRGHPVAPGGWYRDAADALTRARHLEHHPRAGPRPGADPDVARLRLPSSGRGSTAAGRCTRGTPSSPGWSRPGSTRTMPTASSVRSSTRPTPPGCCRTGSATTRAAPTTARSRRSGPIRCSRRISAAGCRRRPRRTELLRRAYPTLTAWHSWWVAYRTGPHGLLAWGSDPVHGDAESATVDRARRESGLDDSPMYDDVVLDPATHTMNLADVGLNALHVVDADALATIAGQLGDSAAAAAYERSARDAARRIDEVLWDQAGRRYRNRWADGGFSRTVRRRCCTRCSAGIPDAARAREVAEALLSPEALGGDPPLPSTARDDPGFSTHYWRGRDLGTDGLPRRRGRAPLRPRRAQPADRGRVAAVVPARMDRAQRRPGELPGGDGRGRTRADGPLRRPHGPGAASSATWRSRSWPMRVRTVGGSPTPAATRPSTGSRSARGGWRYTPRTGSWSRSTDDHNSTCRAA